MPDTFNGQRVEAIPGTPLPYGLVNAANLVLVDDLHELNGVVWQPLSCAEAYTTDWCVDPPPAAKTFDGLEGVEAQPVAVYAGVDCPPIGQSNAEAEMYARAALNMGEQRALEAWVQTQILAPAATNLTPSGPVPVATAMSLLEGTMAVDYGGIAVIHTPAGASPLLAEASQFVKEGARMLSWLGNRFALGGGYQLANVDPDGDPAANGVLWLYISGPVTIRQQQPQVPGARPTGEPRQGEAIVDDAPWEGVINISTNNRLTLAERVSVVQVECAVFGAAIEAPGAVS